jgi:hypothetical protein
LNKNNNATDGIPKNAIDANATNIHKTIVIEVRKPMTAKSKAKLNADNKITIFFILFSRGNINNFERISYMAVRKDPLPLQTF